tara:strand:- start:8403 stop:8636 length:234 start_codon:yes stop_codon:yes gene_type:complete
MTLDELKTGLIRGITEKMTIKELLFHASSHLWFQLEKADENTILARCNDEGLDHMTQEYNFNKRKEEGNATKSSTKK